MYHVIGTGITALLFYLLSYIFCSNGFYSVLTHRKLWNTILAVSFLVTALAGVFMALQINYRWDVPNIKQILKWHVEFGIGMAITGIFHTIWHFRYFTEILSNAERKTSHTKSQNINSNDLRVNLFIVGFVSSSVQLLLIREMINIAGGYELVAGIFLASWLIASSAGAAMAGRSLFFDIKRINLIFSLSPLISVLLLFLLSGLYFNPGQSPSLSASIIFTILVLIPFCIVSGFIFIRLTILASSENIFLPGVSFAVETAGGIISGIIISFLTAGILNTYQILLLIILLTNAYVLLAFFIKKNLSTLLFRLLVILLAAIIIILKPDIFFRQLLLPKLSINYTKDTPYGNISMGEYLGESSIYYNQRLISYKNDVTEKEEDIHYAMLQNQAPESVMLISGSLMSHLPEILKYPVKKIIYIERDPALVNMEQIKKDSLTKNLTIIYTDAFRYIRSMKEYVDVVILLVPPPSTLLLNRYYTTEFFREVRQQLKPGGTFMCSPGPGDNYLNKESLKLYSSVFNSLSAVFKNVIPLSGNKLYFIASDNELSSSVCSMADIKKIKNIYVGSNYFDDNLIEQKTREIVALINRNQKENSAVNPVANYHFQSYNFSKYLNEKKPSIIIILLAFALPFLTVKKRNMTMYFAASALAGFEIILLVTLQLTIGNMYQLTGIIISSLLGGLAIGASTNNILINSITLRKKCFILILFFIIIGAFYKKILLLNSPILVISILAVSALIPAIFTGSIFRMQTINKDDYSASPATYSADLSGSAIGFILVSGFTLPIFGTVISIYLLSLMIFAGILFGTIGNK